MYNHPYFRRIYMQALMQIADGPMADENWLPIVDSRYRALQANGVTISDYRTAVQSGPNITIPAFMRDRRTYIYGQLLSYSNVTFAVTSPTTVTASSNLITIAGNALSTPKPSRSTAWSTPWRGVQSPPGPCSCH